MKNTKWISVDAKKKNGFREFTKGSFLLRKEFVLSKPVKNAVMCVAGLGYGEYSVNEKAVTSDVLTTPYTKFDARVLYNTYDISDLLCVGENVIGAFLGNGLYNNDTIKWDFATTTWRGMPKLIMMVEVVFQDGSNEKIVTDSSWKWSNGPCIYNNMREGEIYDARLEQDGWNAPGFSDEGWQNAFICRGPGGILEPAVLPPIRVVRTLKGKYIGNNIYDFGENISGWAHIKTQGDAGTEITLTYSERIDAEGNIDTEYMNMYNFGQLKHCDKYIMKGMGMEEWSPRFLYHGFRYVQVEGAPEVFKIYADVVHTDFKTIGTFECSDDMLNKIHQASCRSTLTNFHSFPTDCPHREQNGWTGDVLASAEQALMNFDIYTAYQKWLNDFKDVQRPDGQLPALVPTPGWGYNWGSGPAWDSALIQIPWFMYVNTANPAVITQMWENMNRYMSYLEHMNEGFLVDFGLGDWCAPENAVLCPTAVTDTALYFANAIIMSRCAEILREREQANKYAKLAENIKAAYRKAFLEHVELEKSQTFLACGIYNQLYTEEEVPQKAKLLNDLVINNGWHIDCGILGTKYIFSSLSDNGYCETAYKMVINPTAPSYAFWINSGMTTLCERWDMVYSLNHHMFSEVDNWFYKHLAGIQICGKNITIKPCFIPQVRWLKATHRGISVTYDDGKFEVVVPNNAKIVLGNRIYEVEAGKWEFLYDWTIFQKR